jgi:hypothetical protein
MSEDIFAEPVKTKDDRYPLYPRLSEEGRKEAERVIEWAKKKLKDVCDEALGQIYVDIPSYIESDSWTNFRNDMMDGFKDYKTRMKQGEYDFKLIRQKIYGEFRDEIIKDLDRDNLARIKELESEVGRLRDQLDSAYRRYP